MQISVRKEKHLDRDQTLTYIPLGEPAEEVRVMSPGWLEEFCSCFKFCYAAFT